MSEECSTHRRDEKCIQNFVGKPEVKRPFGKPRSRWEDNFRLDLRKIGWKGLKWMHVAQDKEQWWDLWTH
jgi:hypothetical protein